VATQKVFNKLVRDKIPEIILRNGGTPEYEVLEDDDYIKMLDKKLAEECKEVLSALNTQDKIEELADLMEVVMAIIKYLKVDFKALENIRLEKRNRRGGFDSRIFLKSTTLTEKLD
jgi:Uncharacterized conserved protein